MNTNNNIMSHLTKQMSAVNVSQHRPARKAATKSSHKLGNTKTRKSVKVAAVSKKKNNNVKMGSTSRTRKNKTVKPAKPVNINAIPRYQLYVEVEKIRDYFERKNRGEVVHKPLPAHVQNKIRENFHAKLMRILKNINKQLGINQIIKAGYLKNLNSGKFTQAEYNQKMESLEQGELIFYSGKQAIEKALETPKNVDELAELFKGL